MSADRDDDLPLDPFEHADLDWSVDVPMEWSMDHLLDRPLLAADDDLDAELDATEALGAELAQLLVPPPDLERRTTAVVTDGLLARSTMSAAVDLLGTGWRVLRLFAPRADESDGEHRP